MWLVLVTGAEERVVRSKGKVEAWPPVELLRIEPFGSEDSALAFIASCLDERIRVSRPREIGRKKGLWVSEMQVRLGRTALPKG